jgi:hypothetical protein
MGPRIPAQTFRLEEGLCYRRFAPVWLNSILDFSPTLSVFFESIKKLIFSSENNKDSQFNSLPVSRTGKCWRLHKFCGSTGIDVEGEHHHLLSWQPYGLIS